MKTKQKKVLKELVGMIKSSLKPEKIILFGSKAKGRGDNSDYDIAVDALVPDSKTKRILKENLDERAGLGGVDLIFLREAEAGFIGVIKSTGKVIYEKRKKAGSKQVGKRA